MPLPKHEKAKVLIGDMVKILLDELDIDNEGFGSTTFKREDMAVGIEPDDCFYISHSAQMIGKDRIDLKLDLPPDLAIAVDITSKTGLDAYQSLGVPELWWFENDQLRISILKNREYQDSIVSLIFPDIPIVSGISEFVDRSQTKGRSQTLKEFRHWVQEIGYG